jgi:hypothetical protein
MTNKQYTGATIMEICNNAGVDPFMVYVHHIYECGHEDLFDDCVPLSWALEIYHDKICDCEIIEDPDPVDDPLDSLLGDNRICKITVIKGSLCPKCFREGIRRYCDEGPRPVGFDTVTLYHGVAAYNVDSYMTMDTYSTRILDIVAHPEWQICCSTKPLGFIGIAVKGEVLCASNADLYTSIGDNGRRYYDARRYRATHLIYDAKDLDDSVWSHNEIVTRNNVIRWVWIQESASDSLKDQAKKLARDLKVKYMEVSTTSTL